MIKATKPDLVQTTVLKLFDKMLSSVKKNALKRSANIISSPNIILISSDSDSGLSDTESTVEQPKKKVKRKLFDEGVNHLKKSEKKPNQIELNVPYRNSTVQNTSSSILTLKTSEKDENYEETAQDSSSDDTIIQDSPQSVIVLQNVCLTSTTHVQIQGNSVSSLDKDGFPETPTKEKSSEINPFTNLLPPSASLITTQPGNLFSGDGLTKTCSKNKSSVENLTANLGSPKSPLSLNTEDPTRISTKVCSNAVNCSSVSSSDKAESSKTPFKNKLITSSSANLVSPSSPPVIARPGSSSCKHRLSITPIKDKSNIGNLSGNSVSSPLLLRTSSEYKTPTKNVLKSSPNTPISSSSKIGICKTPSKSFSPQSTPNKSGSPKKEKSPPIRRYLKIIYDLFESVTTSRYVRNLITTDEEKFLKILSKSGPSEKFQFVCLKLYTFKYKWYNIFRFCQKINVNMDETDIIQLHKYLEKNRVVETNFEKENLEDLLRILNLADIKDILAKFKLSNRNMTNKETMIQLILKYCKFQCTLTSNKSSRELVLDEVKHKMGYSIRVHERYLNAVFNIYLLTTFTNPLFRDIQDYFKLMLTDICFPEYAIEDFPVFYSADEFRKYSKAQKYYYDLDTALTEKNHLQASLIGDSIFSRLKTLRIDKKIWEEKYLETPHLKCFTAQQTYISALSHAAKPLMTKFPETVKLWLEYLILNYKTHRTGQWYHELSWLYMKYLTPVDPNHAAKLLIKVLKDKTRYKLSDIQSYKLQERGQQLTLKRYHISQLHHDKIVGLVSDLIKVDDFPTTTMDSTAIRSSELGKKRNYLVQDSDGNKTYMNVENRALEYYCKELGYTDGKHCEGRLVIATFALFFWDIIYDPQPSVPATFLSKLQQVPLDFRTNYFYLHRKDLIDKRLKDIGSEWTDEQVIEFARNNYALHSHESGLCVISDHIENEELLEILIPCVGRRIWSKIYERLVKNMSVYGSGLPDLLIWNIEEKTSIFVEVKGEGDELFPAQKLWLQYLLKIGARAEVCRVHSTGSKRRTKKETKTTPVKRKKSVEDTEGARSKNRTKQKQKTQTIKRNVPISMCSKEIDSEEEAFCPTPPKVKKVTKVPAVSNSASNNSKKKHSRKS